MKRLIAFVAALAVMVPALADEGMWLLPLLNQMNKKDLWAAGCQLTPEEIYNVNKTSLKDAIVQFGGGCTGEIISPEGLLVTNHHCGYGSIQGLSTDEHNYLMDGYWAMTREQEIPVPGLTVKFLQSMTDVTKLLAKKDKKELIAEAEAANPGCTVLVTGFYNENVQYLIVYKIYRDVRFVGAPPASMGKFGGETDNWMWPRHTCDFSMFRVYAGADNEPADYAPENRPYQAKNHLKISLKGVQPGDYTMIMGYPGRTQRFQTAAQLEQMIAVNRIRIDARTLRQGIMWEEMCADPSVQLKYASKYAGSANGWKKWQGEEKAFKDLDIIGRELKKETEFMAWVGKKKSRQESYGTALSTIEASVRNIAAAERAATLLMEAPLRIELAGLAGGFLHLAEKDKAKALEEIRGEYRDYVVALDRKEAVALLTYYREKAAPEDMLGGLGEGFEDLAKLDVEAYVDWLFSNSVFTSFEKLSAASEDLEALEKDPAAVLYGAILGKLMARSMSVRGEREPLAAATKAFAAGLMEWQKGKPSYPDANSTMRLTWGHVGGYSPKDGVQYSYFTTLKGVFEKEDPTNPEFIVPADVKAAWTAKNFGRYLDADGTLHTCFLSNNDITGGNSGSPIMNARGELIGLAFDGNWESMSSDVMFEPALQRCINVDIRYVLWMVDTVGGAGHLVREMELVN
jgi:hypothetical protein